jgi:hypothetical protein
MPKNDNGEGRPNQKLTIEGNKSQNQHASANRDYSPFAPLLQGEQSPNKPGKSHEQLVEYFKSYIDEQQQAYQTIRSPEERETWPPEEIIRKRLDVQSGSTNEQEGEFFSTLRYAWDTLVYGGCSGGTLDFNFFVKNGLAEFLMPSQWLRTTYEAPYQRYE